MENCVDLIKEIQEYDDKMKKIFIKRMKTMEKISFIENKTNFSSNGEYFENINTSKIDKNNNFNNNYRYFIKNINYFDKIYKYSNLPDFEDSFKITLIKEKKDLQTVCYQGLPFSYSESAAKLLFCCKTLISKKTFEDVFKNVQEGVADAGVVPIENSTAGYINDIYDLMLKYDLYINYNYVKKVDHCLAGIMDSSIEEIKEVYSHPQAIMQCKEYIDKYHFRGINEINTAVAAQTVYKINDKKIACICSPEAALHYGLKILEKKISPKHNYTRFVAVSKYLLTDEEHDKISIVFKIPNETGALNEVLSIFSYYNVNLSSIYSRPDLKSPWKYLFYLDFEGNILSKDIRAILFQLANELPFLKLLGSWKD